MATPAKTKSKTAPKAEAPVAAPVVAPVVAAAPAPAAASEKPAESAAPEAASLPRGEGGGRGPQKPAPANRGPQKWNQGNNPAAPRFKGADFKGGGRDKSNFGRKAQGGGGGR